MSSVKFRVDFLCHFEFQKGHADTRKGSTGTGLFLDRKEISPFNTCIESGWIFTGGYSQENVQVLREGRERRQSHRRPDSRHTHGCGRLKKTLHEDLSRESRNPTT